MRSRWTPSIVPNDRDQTVYLVEDELRRNRSLLSQDRDFEADLETTIRDLISGQYNDPVRIVAFNTDEGWSQDVSEDIAREIQRRHDIIAEDVPSHLAGIH